MSATNQLISANANPNNLLGDYWSVQEDSGAGASLQTYIQGGGQVTSFYFSVTTLQNPYAVTFANKSPAGQSKIKIDAIIAWQNASVVTSYNTVTYLTVTYNTLGTSVTYQTANYYVTVPTTTSGVINGGDQTIISFLTPTNADAGNFTVNVYCQVPSSPSGNIFISGTATTIYATTGIV